MKFVGPTPLAVFILTCAMSSNTLGAVAGADFTILQITRYSPSSGSTTAPYGGCLVKVSPSPTTVLAGCRKTYVSLDCNGDYDTRSVSSQKMDMVQLALVTGRTARLVVDDSRLHSSYCFVESAGIKR